MKKYMFVAVLLCSLPLLCSEQKPADAEPIAEGEDDPRFMWVSFNSSESDYTHAYKWFTYWQKVGKMERRVSTSGYSNPYFGSHEYSVSWHIPKQNPPALAAVVNQVKKAEQSK